MESTKLVEKCQHVNDTNITYIISVKKVFREQCMKCYEDPQSEHGLDVCLKCFSGNCKSELFDHSNLHYMQKNHPLVLNIKEKLIVEEQIEKENEKENNEKEKTPKITKIAIGKPGGADLASNENWERLQTVHCKVCNLDIDYSKTQKLNDLVTSILNSSSAENIAKVEDWELEIHPCEHTLTLIQDNNVQVASKLNATCSECNISTALWLCLTCGNLACGRKNHDGTGGNGHAMIHYKATKHPLVVKTGTITSDGSASLYCYTCDNDVKDPELPLHLSKFGIDVTTAVKTEKTMTELNIEINLNFTLSKSYEDGKELVPVYGPGNTGLENLGNSCYMNSVIQILFSLEPFQKLYYDTALEHLSTCFTNPEECFACQMSKVMYGMHSGNYSTKLTKFVNKSEENKEGIEEYQKGIKPSSFKLFFGKDHPEFSSNKQQDAFEYISHLLQRFERQEKINNRYNPRKSFEFNLETRLECTQCHNVKYKTQKDWCLTLNVPDWEKKKEENTECLLEECVMKFLGEDRVDLQCLNCNSSTTWIKTQRIKSFPQYLIIIFERFVYDWVPIKLETRLAAPITDFDVSILASSHAKQDEKVIIDLDENKEEEIEPDFDKAALNLLMGNGVPELAAKHALLKNDNNPDLAICWFFDNMDSPVLTLPIPKIKKAKSGNMAISINSIKKVPEELIENLIIIIGCTRSQAEGALIKCNNNADRAVDYIFSHPEENFEEPMQDQVAEVKQTDEVSSVSSFSPIYDLYAFITHLGRNTSHGHYVCHIRKKNQWIYYNDSKVSISQDPPIYKGYILFYKNKQN